MEFKEWLDHEVTKYMLKEIEDERRYALESIILSANKEESCGVVKGLSRSIQIINNIGRRS